MAESDPSQTIGQDKSFKTEAQMACAGDSKKSSVVKKHKWGKEEREVMGP